MSSPSDNTRVELLIAEARAAGDAGVFRRTDLDYASLLEQPRPSRLVRFYERAIVGLPIAACLAIVVGIAATEDRSSTGSKPTPLASLHHSATTQAGYSLCSMDLIAECVAGPNTPATGECACADLDRDGDVDLSDLGSYQRLAVNE
jgi:hypothetical protein